MPPALSEIQRKNMATCTNPDGMNSIITTCTNPGGINSIITTYTGPDGMKSIITTCTGPNGIKSIITTSTNPDGINSIPTTCTEPTVLQCESRRDGSSCNRGFYSVDMRYEIWKEFGEKSRVSKIDWTTGRAVVIHRTNDIYTTFRTDKSDISARLGIYGCCG